MFWSEQALSRRRTNETPCRCTCTARNFPTARTTIFSHHEWIGNANNGRIFHYYILSSHQWISQTPNAETVCLSTSPYLFWLFACERNELLVYASRERKRERTACTARNHGPTNRLGAWRRLMLLQLSVLYRFETSFVYTRCSKGKCFLRWL